MRFLNIENILFYPFKNISYGSGQTKGSACHWTLHGASPSTSILSAQLPHSSQLSPSLPVCTPLPPRRSRRSAPSLPHGTRAAPAAPRRAAPSLPPSLPPGTRAADTPPTTTTTSPQASSVDSLPVQAPTKVSHGRKVCNVTRGSAKWTLEISLLSQCFSLLLVTMIVMNSWAYQGPDSGLSAGRRASRRNVQLQAGVRLPACSPLNYPRRQSRHWVKDQGIVSRRSFQGFIVLRHGTEDWQAYVSATRLRSEPARP